MTSAADPSEIASAHPGPDLSFASASPAEIRRVLTPESAGEFDRQWRGVMARATESLDLTELHQVLAGWRQVATLTVQLGHDGYREFETLAHRRLAQRQAEGPDAEIGFGLAEAEAVIRYRLAHDR